MVFLYVIFLEFPVQFSSVQFSQSIVSEKILCGLRNACTALVASCRQYTTYLATRVKTSSHIFGDEVKTRAKREATIR